jgi:hypothetical protein
MLLQRLVKVFAKGTVSIDDVVAVHQDAVDPIIFGHHALSREHAQLILVVRQAFAARSLRIAVFLFRLAGGGLALEFTFVVEVDDIGLGPLALELCTLGVGPDGRLDDFTLDAADTDQFVQGRFYPFM